MLYKILIRNILKMIVRRYYRARAYKRMQLAVGIYIKLYRVRYRISGNNHDRRKQNYVKCSMHYAYSALERKIHQEA